MLDLICFGSLNTILYPRVSFSLCSDSRFGLRRLKHESDSRISRVAKGRSPVASLLMAVLRQGGLY
jgi:hypothetical protein